ncbi:M50 family metallopeptidase [Aquibacillus koreensis]|uniref:M50 family metallopeptidase n=1 Tax=Aquibacillus koreensis TaxID=279446 RepID=A0A9X3WNY5_9BACI|nr:M50 family metallopeptidase [Aquibacillus koreensis]MCT2537309.1 M50 family metallopeptidase [Aquibacillus koreensis]MDC3421656.1 M50 family metallopeptidase [Aquibacillus koreensis]
MESFFEFIVIFLLFIGFIFPLSTFIHELGHGLTALVLSKYPVEIRLGSSSKSFDWRIGRLTIKMQPFSGWIGFVQYRVTTGEDYKRDNNIILLNGPISSLVFSFLSYLLLRYINLPEIPYFIINAIMIASLVQFFITILPIKYPFIFGAYRNTPSDGYTILKLLKNK